jgi:hypothetical protein
MSAYGTSRMSQVIISNTNSELDQIMKTMLINLDTL